MSRHVITKNKSFFFFLNLNIKVKLVYHFSGEDKDQFPFPCIKLRIHLDSLDTRTEMGFPFSKLTLVTTMHLENISILIDH